MLYVTPLVVWLGDEKHDDEKVDGRSRKSHNDTLHVCLEIVVRPCMFFSESWYYDGNKLLWQQDTTAGEGGILFCPWVGFTRPNIGV